MSRPQPHQGKQSACPRKRRKRKRDPHTTSQGNHKRGRTAPLASSLSDEKKPNTHPFSKLDKKTKTFNQEKHDAHRVLTAGLDTSNNSPDPPSSPSTTGSMHVHGRTPEPTSSPLYTMPYGSLHSGAATLAIGLGTDAAERKEHVRTICDLLKGMEREGLKGTVLRPESFLAVKFGSVAERDLAGRMVGDSLGRVLMKRCKSVEASDAADGALGKLKEVSDVIQGLGEEMAALRSMLLAYGMEPGKMKEALELVMGGVKADLAIFI